MSGGGQGMSAGGGGQFGGLPLGNGGAGQVPGRPPMMGGQPGQSPPMMGPGGPGGFREGPYQGPQPGQMGGMDARNPSLGGFKGPQGGMLPENFLNMMRQRQQQGLLGGMKTGGLDDTQMQPMPQGVGIGMSPPRMPPLQPGGGNEMAQIMAQYGR